MSAEILTGPFGAMREPIAIADHLALPVDVVTQRVAFLGMSGSGKSTGGKRLVEQLLAAGQQVIILDPKGDAHGLRTLADGTQPGFGIPILGGNRGDGQIDPESGERIAAEVLATRSSLLLDTSFLRQGEFLKFTGAFLEAVYRGKARTENQQPLHVVIDEADLVMAQRPAKGAQQLTGAAEDLVRRGRQRGIGCTMISQRPAVISKSCLSQVQIMVALRTTAPGDLLALKSWVLAYADDEAVKAFMSSVSSLQRGEAWVFSPAWPTPDGIRQRVRILPITTWDSGAAPLPGQPRVEPTAFAEVDPGVLARLVPAPPPPPAPPAAKGPKVNLTRPLRALMGQYQRAVVTARLEAHAFNMTATAASLGVERSYLYRLMDRLKIQRPEPPAPPVETPAS